MSRTTEFLLPQPHSDDWTVRYHRGRPRTQKESIGLDDLPEAVRRLLEATDHVRLVETLYPESDTNDQAKNPEAENRGGI